LAGGVNIVNAEVLLRERGIELAAQSRSEMGDFRSLITAEVVTDQGTFTAAGTNFGQSMLRLVRLGETSSTPAAQRGQVLGSRGAGGDYRLESYLDGIMMIFSHRDVPGIIGKIGTICGGHQVNIAQMAVGRATETPGGDAIGVLNVDNEPPPAALEEITKAPNITSVRVIHLPPADQMPAWMG
jgi:D-3-phosphoglycerate dehydrogenase